MILCIIQHDVRAGETAERIEVGRVPLDARGLILAPKGELGAACDKPRAGRDDELLQGAARATVIWARPPNIVIGQ